MSDYLSYGFLKLLLTVLVIAAACADQTAGEPRTEKRQATPAVPVVVATVTQKTISVQLSVIGTVQAYSTVSVKAQVGGELIGVHFTEGQDVRQGELLFTIDPRPFEAALRQAEANLAKDMAQAKNAEVDAQRYAVLVTKSFTSREQYDATRTNAAALAATVRADEAAVATAKLQLAYC